MNFRVHSFISLSRTWIILGALILMTVLPSLASAAMSNAGEQPARSSFYYPFNWTGTLEQTSTMEQSRSPFYWLSSGGRVIFGNGVGQTMHGDAPQDSDWQKVFAKTKPASTDNGTHPQNVFRLLTKDVWQNADQQIQVRVDATQRSDSPYRKASNGIFLVNRYDRNADNYYVAGIRVDGHAVIKKKLNGRYYTLAYASLLSNGATYDRETNPNLIPHHQWFGLKTTVKDRADGSVEVSLYYDATNSNKWVRVASAIDSGNAHGSVLSTSGHGGVWTDYMDMTFDNYRLRELAQSIVESPTPEPTPEPAPAPEPTPEPTPTPEAQPEPAPAPTPEAQPEPAPAPTPVRRLLETFSPDGVIEEAGSMSRSMDSNFWLNSGAYLYKENGIGRTIFGELPIGSKWQVAFENYNSASTDGGVHPQNIFRLVTKSQWQDQRQQMYFNIAKINESDGKHRNQSNGVLLFNRYADSDNLYYAGIRVDGKAVIKKKINGRYYTLDINRVYSGTYNRASNPNLIPTNRWIGLRSITTNLSNGRVRIDLYMDLNNSGEWSLVASAIDNGSSYGGRAITQEAHSGIRTDFMDVKFDNYEVVEM